MTGRDLIRRALMLIGVLAEGENPSAPQQSDGLESLNDLLDSWSTEGLIIPHVVREEFSLVPGQASYTMGPGGDFDTAKPIRIEKAGLLLVGPGEPSELPVDILNLDQWACIGMKSQQSDIPTKLYEESTHPVTTLFPWPVPRTAHKLVLYSQKALSRITNPNAEIVLPEGYARALRYNLAIEVCSEYGRSMSPEALLIAGSSKEVIKRKNIKPVYMTSDAVGLASRGRFNILTGGWDT